MTSPCSVIGRTLTIQKTFSALRSTTSYGVVLPSGCASVRRESERNLPLCIVFLDCIVGVCIIIIVNNTLIKEEKKVASEGYNQVHLHVPCF